MHKRRPGTIEPKSRVASRDLPPGKQYKSFAVGLAWKNCQKNIAPATLMNRRGS